MTNASMSVFKVDKYEAETEECEGKQQLSVHVKTFI